MTALTPWLSSVGKYTVEHINAPHFNQAIDMGDPPAAIFHTTEGGGWGSLDDEFEHHFAPHFLVGAGRIQQLVPIGLIGLACKTHNWMARVQVEVIAKSDTKPWLPDQPTLDVLAELMKACFLEYSIPLSHPWPDGDFGLAGPNPHRSSGKVGKEAGWFGHGDMPSPDIHWDPGNLEWSKVFALAQSKIGPPPQPIALATGAMALPPASGHAP